IAILATRRRWLVTSLCAASRSPCSRQLLASMYSSCGSNIGNRRISSKYRDRPVSADRIGKAAARAMVAPFRRLPPFGGPFRNYPSPGAGNRNVLVQLRSSVAVAATIHGISAEREVTDRSHRLEGVVMVTGCFRLGACFGWILFGKPRGRAARRRTPGETAG